MSEQTALSVTDTPTGRAEAERVAWPDSRWSKATGDERLAMLRSREDLLWLCQGWGDGDHAQIVRGWSAIVRHYASLAVDYQLGPEAIAETVPLFTHADRWDFGQQGTASMIFDFEDGGLSYTLVTDAGALAQAPAAAGVVGVRPEVATFALLMERELRANDHKPGWKDDEPTALSARVIQEAIELHGETASLQRQVVWRPSRGRGDRGNGWVRLNLETGKREVGVGYAPAAGEKRAAIVERITSEAADVASMAMMVADVCGCLDEFAAPPQPRPAPEGSALEIDYTNYRGERSTRTVIPTGRLLPGDATYHPTARWVVEAWDIEKGAMRTFDPTHIHAWGDQNVNADPAPVALAQGVGGLADGQDDAVVAGDCGSPELPIAPTDQVQPSPTMEALCGLAVRQIIADVDRITTGRRRVDIAHALLRIVAHEIAANADTPAAAKHRGQLVAKDLKAAVRERYAVRQRQAGAP